FQAEDGIRDFHVTGVQTCALPISFMSSLYTTACSSSCRAHTQFPGKRMDEFFLRFLIRKVVIFFSIVSNQMLSLLVLQSMSLARSEERRVGKECRCGRSAWQ